MRALAANRDAEFVARRGDRTGLDRELSGRKTRQIVYAEDRIHGKAIKESFLDHDARAAAAFFSRLEDEVDRTIEVTRLGEVLGRREQHRGMPVVTARMHLAGKLAGMAEPVRLRDRQGVDVGPEPDGARRGAAFDHADDARLRPTSMDRNTPFAQDRRDTIGRAMLLKAEFRMGMKIAAKSRERSVVVLNIFDQEILFHDFPRQV